jgi:hypothetical protein
VDFERGDVVARGEVGGERRVRRWKSRWTSSAGTLLRAVRLEASGAFAGGSRGGLRARRRGPVCLHNGERIRLFD